MDVVAAALDQILGAARQKKLAVGDVADVPGVEPIAAEQLRGGLRLAVVADCGGGTAEFDAALGSRSRASRSAIIHDADLVSRREAARKKRLPARPPHHRALEWRCLRTRAHADRSAPPTDRGATAER